MKLKHLIKFEKNIIFGDATVQKYDFFEHVFHSFFNEEVKPLHT